MGFLPLGMEAVPQGLDLNTVELFARFFTIEEMVNTLHLEQLSVQELTLLKGALLQELAKQLAADAVRSAVRTRVQIVAGILPGASSV